MHVHMQRGIARTLSLSKERLSASLYMYVEARFDPP
jgi:hypothetical protein